MTNSTLSIGIHSPKSSEHLWKDFKNFLKTYPTSNPPIKWSYEDSEKLPVESDNHFSVRLTEDFKDLAPTLPLDSKSYSAFICLKHPLLAANIPPNSLATLCQKSILIGTQTKPTETDYTRTPLVCIDSTASKDFLNLKVICQSLNEKQNLKQTKTLPPLNDLHTLDTSTIVIATKNIDYLKRLTRLAAEKAIRLLALVSPEDQEKLYFERSCLRLVTLKTGAKLRATTHQLLEFLEEDPTTISPIEAIMRALSFEGVRSRLVDLANQPGTTTTKLKLALSKSTAPLLDQIRQHALPQIAFRSSPEELQDASLNRLKQPQQSSTQRYLQLTCLLSPNAYPNSGFKKRLIEDTASSFISELLFDRYGNDILPTINALNTCLPNWDSLTSSALKPRIASKTPNRPFQTLLANRYAESAAINASTYPKQSSQQIKQAESAFKAGIPLYKNGRGSARNLNALVFWIQGDTQAATQFIEADYQNSKLAKDRYFDLATLGPKAKEDIATALELMEKDWHACRLSPPATIAYLSALYRTGSKKEACEKLASHYLDYPNSKAVASSIALHLRSDFSQSLDQALVPSNPASDALREMQSLLDYDRAQNREAFQTHSANIVCQAKAHSYHALCATVQTGINAAPQKAAIIFAVAFRSLGRHDQLEEAIALEERFLPAPSPVSMAAWSEFLASQQKSRRLPFATLDSHRYAQDFTPVLEYLANRFEPQKLATQLAQTIAAHQLYSGHYQKESCILAKLRKTHGSNAIHYTALALKTWATGDQDAALTLAKRDTPTLDSTPTELLAHATLSGILGQTDQAKTCLQSLAQLAPRILNLDSPLPKSTLVWMSLLSQSIGHPHAAQHYRERYLASEPAYDAAVETSFLDQACAKLAPIAQDANEVCLPVQLPTSALSS